MKIHQSYRISNFFRVTLRICNLILVTILSSCNDVTKIHLSPKLYRGNNKMDALTDEELSMEMKRRSDLLEKKWQTEETSAIAQKRMRLHRELERSLISLTDLDRHGEFVEDVSKDCGLRFRRTKLYKLPSQW